MRLFDTSQLTEAMSAFYGCISLSNINFENLDTRKAENLNYMFNYCPSLTSLYLPGLNTNHMNGYGINDMFGKSENLTLYIHMEKNIDLVNNLPEYVDVHNISDY